MSNVNLKLRPSIEYLISWFFIYNVENNILIHKICSFIMLA